MPAAMVEHALRRRRSALNRSPLLCRLLPGWRGMSRKFKYFASSSSRAVLAMGLSKRPRKRFLAWRSASPALSRSLRALAIARSHGEGRGSWWRRSWPFLSSRLSCLALTSLGRTNNRMAIMTVAARRLSQLVSPGCCCSWFCPPTASSGHRGTVTTLSRTPAPSPVCSTDGGRVSGGVGGVSMLVDVVARTLGDRVSLYVRHEALGEKIQRSNVQEFSSAKAKCALEPIFCFHETCVSTLPARVVYWSPLSPFVWTLLWVRISP